MRLGKGPTARAAMAVVALCGVSLLSACGGSDSGGGSSWLSGQTEDSGDRDGAEDDKGGEGKSGEEPGVDWQAVAEQLAADPTDYASPQHALGDDGLTILMGDADDANVLTLAEEPRCPACAQFTQRIGPTIQQAVADGDYAVEYVFGTFFDRDGSNASRQAVSALGAALHVGPEAFQGYLHQLYAPEVHPGHDGDVFADAEQLIDIAQAVPELAGNGVFADAVRAGTFAPWALKISDKFDESGITATPTLLLNGEEAFPSGPPQTSEEFTRTLEAQLR